jgi:histidinol dehydrogenase
MIRVYENQTAFRVERRSSLQGAGQVPDEVLRRVEKVLQQIQKDGDAALLAWIEKLDGVPLKPNQLRVSQELIEASASQASESLRSVLERAASNVRAFHQRQREQGWTIKNDDGSFLGQKVTPLGKVGIYVPGGKATYPSTLIMSSIPAQIAGVAHQIVATPPGTIERSAALAYAVQMLGITDVYQIGGAQAIGALAFGTETVPRVDKIVGPGNIYVATAKKLVFGQVGIDAIAGPSEIVVLADETADPAYVAADLLSQAEHASGEERAVLVSTSSDLVNEVAEEVTRQLKGLPRAEEIEKILQKHGAAVVVASMEEGVSLVNEIAPEHLEILARDEEQLAEQVSNAGAIFLGEHSPVPVGDFYAGPNHVLPTGTTARFTSPLGVYDFVKRTSLIRYSRKKLARDREDIETFARVEGFEAHARSIAVRFGR